MKTTKTTEKGEPQFHYEPRYAKDSSTFMLTVVEKGDERLYNLCELHHYTYDEDKSKHYWKISRTSPEEYAGAVSHKKFATKEEAGEFYYMFRKAVVAGVAKNPVEPYLAQYLLSRSDDIRREYEALRGRMVQIQCEVYTLNEFAKKNNLKRVEYMTESTDVVKAIRDLLSFEICIQNPDYDPKAKKPGKKDKPILGENGQPVHLEHLTLTVQDAIFLLNGKEEYRTYRARLYQLIKCLDPALAEHMDSKLLNDPDEAEDEDEGDEE